MFSQLLRLLEILFVATDASASLDDDEYELVLKPSWNANTDTDHDQIRPTTQALTERHISS